MAKKAASPGARKTRTTTSSEARSNDSAFLASSAEATANADKDSRTVKEAISKSDKENIVNENDSNASPRKKRKQEDTSASEDQKTNNGNKSQKEGGDEETDADIEEDSKPAATKPDISDIDLTKPIKRARTAYFIFSDERRAEIQTKHKGEGVATVARELGKIWASMPPEEKEIYQEKAALERDRVAKQLEQLEAAGIDLAKLPGAATAQTVADPNAMVFPVNRIRKICLLDPEVKKISKEALLLVTKCSELFSTKLGIEAVRVAQIQNRRTLLPEDVAQVCGTREAFSFLRDDVRDLVREQAVQKQQQKDAGGNSKNKTIPPLASGKPLTAYFEPKSS